MTVVADAGPLIALAQIGRLNLLQLLYDELYLPPAVTPLLDELIVSGFRMDEEPYRTVQRLADEAED